MIGKDKELLIKCYKKMGIARHQSLPQRAGTQPQGLYDASHEHDACGVGMVVNIHGNKSHNLVDNALKVLENMRHRGAEGADGRTGDGAGIMLQIPHEFILLQGIPVPEKGKYGTGVSAQRPCAPAGDIEHND